MKAHRVLRAAYLTAAIAAAATLAACSSSSPPAASSSPSAGSADASAAGATYTPAEVAAASGSYKVTPIFAVPKKLPQHYTFAFINNGENYPYFEEWHLGMEAAAKFYGVSFQDASLNLNYENAMTSYQQLALRNPQVVGTGSGPMTAPLYNAITKAGSKVLLIDATYQNAPNFGVDNTQVGQLAIQILDAPAKQKMAGAWKGKQVDVVGLSAPDCPACDARVRASFAEAQSTLGIPSSHDFFLVPPGTDPTTSAQSTFTDWLTAHPGADALVVSYGDEPVIGAVNAAKADNRGSDILAVSNGGDPAAQTALREPSNAGILVAAIDYKPYQEGWNWIEAAIALELGKPFGTYKVSQVLTPQNINTYYPSSS